MYIGVDFAFRRFFVTFSSETVALCLVFAVFISVLMIQAQLGLLALAFAEEFGDICVTRR
jgi:hypothetical protein